MTEKERADFILMRNQPARGGSTGTLTAEQKADEGASLSGWHQFLIINDSWARRRSGDSTIVFYQFR